MEILKTRKPKLLLALAAVWLVLAYMLISVAINSGSLLQWLVGLFFVGWAISEIVRAIYYSIVRHSGGGRNPGREQ